MADDFEINLDDLFEEEPVTPSGAVAEATEIITKQSKALPAPKKDTSTDPIAEPLTDNVPEMLQRLDRIVSMVEEIRKVVDRMDRNSGEAGDTAPPRIEDPDNLLDVFEPEDEPVTLKAKTRGRPRKS